MPADVTQALSTIGLATWHALIDAWPVSVGVLLCAAAALIVNGPLRHFSFRRRVVAIGATYLFPVVMIGAGAVLHFDEASRSFRGGSGWRVLILWVILLVHIVVVGYSSLSFGESRFRTTAVALPGLWVTLCACLVSAVFIAGIGS